MTSITAAMSVMATKQPMIVFGSLHDLINSWDPTVYLSHRDGECLFSVDLVLCGVREVDAVSGLPVDHGVGPTLLSVVRAYPEKVP